jgi:hypothetical protein
MENRIKINTISQNPTFEKLQRCSRELDFKLRSEQFVELAGH